jgi:phospholipid-binding lipoprotein MlaA
VRFFGTLVVAVFLAGGCATVDSGDPRDPFEGFNRGVYRFNEVVDDAVARPVATAYRDLVHEEIRNRVRNFFSNIGDLFIGVNDFLQGKFYDGFEDWARFVFNSTIGLFGLHDVASDMGIEKRNEDFGQTFGRWGVGEGPYLVLPILGSSTVRDGVGTALDLYFDPLGDLRPINLRNSLTVLRLTGVRADLLDASRILEQAALDKYVFQRDAYLQRRRNLVYDGSPPREPREPEEPAKESPAKEPPAKEAPAKEAPVNPGPRSDVSIYLPRIPRNNEAVMATGHAITP